MSNKRVRRMSRSEKFAEELLPLLKEKYRIGNEFNGQYFIEDTPFGLIRIYTRTDKVHITKDNKWIISVESWCRKHLLC